MPKLIRPSQRHLAANLKIGTSTRSRIHILGPVDQSNSYQINDYTNYYNFKTDPFTYKETYDHSRGRSKTATLSLYRVDEAFVEPTPDSVIRIYRDKDATDLVFGGVITDVNESIITKGDGDFYVRKYDLTLSGYDPITLQYREVTSLERININSGRLIAELINTYAPWIDTTDVDISSSPVIKHIRIIRKKLDDVINNILEKTGWTFFIDDYQRAHYGDEAAMTLNWTIDEGTSANPYPAFDPKSLNIKTNTQEEYNDITFVGGTIKGNRVTETFVFNSQEALKSLLSIPFGLDSNVLFLDKHDTDGIDEDKWTLNDPAVKLTQVLGRLQINGNVGSSATMISQSVFDRSQLVEYRAAEIEIVNGADRMQLGFYGAASNGAYGIDSHLAVNGLGSNPAYMITNGLGNYVNAGDVSRFIHSFIFDCGNGKLQIGEDLQEYDPSFGVFIGPGIYGIKIKLKTLGSEYYIQGGRYAYPAELGALGSKTWTKVFESSTNSVAFFGLANDYEGLIGATVIGQKVSTDIDVKAVLLAGGYLGTQDPVNVDTNLEVGTDQSADFETDCYVGVDGNNSAFISFYTDDIPNGTVRVSYNATDTNFKERVYSDSGKLSVRSRSTLYSDDGTRNQTIANNGLVADPQDARQLLVSAIQDSTATHYIGSVSTTSDHLLNLSPSPGDKPYAGQVLTFNLPDTAGKPSFSERITNVSATDVGAAIYQYDIQFGDSQVDLTRLFLKITRKTTDIEIIDDGLPAVDADAEELNDALIPRPDTPDLISAVYDSTGVHILWTPTSVNYELRDNLNARSGQGGAILWQIGPYTSYDLPTLDIQTYYRKRKFKMYVWSIDINNRWSKYPLAITVENPAPEPQPIRDIAIVNGTTISIRFSPEVEPDILPEGRRVQISTTRDMTALVVNQDIPTWWESFDYIGIPQTTYYVRYGLRDTYSDTLGDIEWSGVREVSSSSGDFSGSAQYLNNIPPDNGPVNVTVANVQRNVLQQITLGWQYTQSDNVATHFGIIVKFGGGPISFATNADAQTSYLVEAENVNGQQQYNFSFLGARQVYSFRIYGLAVTAGGTIKNTVTFADLMDWTPTGYQGNLLGSDIAGDANFTNCNLIFGGVDANSASVYPIGNQNKMGLLTNQWFEAYAIRYFENGKSLDTVYAKISQTNAFEAVQHFLKGLATEDNVFFNYGRGIVAGNTAVVLYDDKVQLIVGSTIIAEFGADTKISVAGVLKTLSVDGSGFVKAT